MYAILIFSLLQACSTSPETFGEDVARVECTNTRTCNRESFESDFSDLDDCIETVSAFYGYDCFEDNCASFDTKAANTCLSDLAQQSCTDDSIPDECTDAWQDCDNISLGACLVLNGLDVVL